MTLRELGVTAIAIGAFCVPVTGCTETELGPEREERTARANGPRERDAPGSRSGDLGTEDLPAPEAFGRGWQYRVDPGDPEEGYVGSGQPAIEREPASVLAAITPLGCRPQPLPLPLRALEVTYQRGNDAPGVGLILEFDADEAAREFFDVHTTVIAECVDSRHIDVEVLQTSSSTFVSSRTEEVGQTPSWIEGLMLRGDRLTLIAVADPTSRGVDAVVSALD